MACVLHFFIPKILLLFSKNYHTFAVDMNLQSHRNYVLLYRD